MTNPGKRRKKQFSLSLLVRVFLALLAVVSLIVFATSIMRGNELDKEKKRLEAERDALQEEKEELIELKNSGDAGEEAYIVRIAKKVWRLFFPDEEIIYNN